MADRNINLSIRKPRRLKGTPAYRQRNVFAFGAIFLGASCWTLYEYWSQTQKLKKSIAEGKFAYSPEYKNHLMQMRLSFDPHLTTVVSHMREREAAEKPRTQSWISKVLSSSPDL